jgi:hypothetical protein
MPFPFLTPIPLWVQQIMEDRESDKLNTTFKTPWITITSGALVVKGSPVKSSEEQLEKIKEYIKTAPAQSYKGCIISNNYNNLELNYSLHDTPVGIDFDGKIIRVENEKGKLVSTPIITSVDIDTDGANNTLKTARVNVKCFTLKQLEMFELFFLKPGMNVLVEFGDVSLLPNLEKSKSQTNPSASVINRKKYNTLISGKAQNITPFENITQAMVDKRQNFDNFCENFSKYYRSNTEAIANYIQNVERSLGSYDLVAGKVTDYSFSIQDDGTYDVNFEVSQGNQISLAIPHNSKKSASKVSTQSKDTEFTGFDQILELLIQDLNLGDGISFKAMIKGPHPETNGKWSNEFFNFLKINEQQKDTVASDDAYVSLRFILSILMNYAIDGGNVDKKFFEFNLPTYLEKVNDTNYKGINVLPVNSSKYIMSSTDSIIFPSKRLPKLITKKKSNDASKTGTTEIKTDENEITMSGESEFIDGSINGYEFNMTKSIFIPNDPNRQEINTTSSNNSDAIGNALNIFIKYENIVNYWNSSKTRIEFLERVLNSINENGYGLFTLIFGLQEQSGGPTVIDAKLTSSSEYIKNQQDSFNNVYRFKPTTIKSNVKQFTFNFELSNLAAGRQIFNSGKLIAEAKSKQSNVTSDKLETPASVYKSADNSTMANADGWYSINKVEVKTIEESFKELTRRVQSAESSSQSLPTTQEATSEAEDLNDVIDTKSIKFLVDENKTTTRTLIFKDDNIIYKKIYDVKEAEKTRKPTLSPIDITLVVDGFSGFVPGQCFRVDGIPEIYNQTGVFQITNTKHNMTTEGWDTTIEASHRIIN